MKQPYCVLGVPALFFLSIGSAQVTYNTVPTRISGQAIIQHEQLTATAPNLTDGREFYFPQSVAVDTTVSPAILYVADTDNNRVLAWNSVSGFGTGSTANLVIGQTDLYSTQAQGPGRSSSVGLSAPTGLAVDAGGNLYVTDAGNNRILRFPKPFSQPAGPVQPDLVIGQISFNANTVNQGLSAPTASTLAMATGSSVLQAGLALDSAGNLWVSDPGNNRVLRFPKSVLTAGALGPAASLVLGQANFGTSALASNPVVTGKNFLYQPSGIALDPEGRLYVADGANRVVVWANPAANGQLADRIIGVVVATAAQPTAGVSQSTLKAPSGIVFVGDNPYVMDTGDNRILGYPPFSQWSSESVAFSPAATQVIGQLGFTSNSANGGNTTPNAQALFAPTAAALAGSDLLVADANNNRVLDFPVSGTTVSLTASRVLGQSAFQYRAINLTEGREVFFNGFDPALGAGISGGSVAVDTSSNPPHLYVSDTGNHRILGFRDVRKVSTGTIADLVIGQVDFGSNQINYPFNNGTKPSAAGLFLPQGIAVDGAGNLWVADFGNSRVLRFAAPFNGSASASNGPPSANLVLGQSSMVGPTLTDATARTMSGPYGVSVAPNGDVYAADSVLNRVLVFRKPASGDFTSGQSADVVIGQNTFFDQSAQPLTAGLSSPRALATDSGDRLYVADSGNGRIAIYSDISTAQNNPTASLSVSGFSQPNGVGVSSAGNIWIADTNNDRVLEYPSYDLLPINPTPISTLSSGGPLSVAADAAGNPIIAEAVNRVSFYYPTMTAENAANFFPRYAPGMLATLAAIGSAQFGPATASSTASGPWPVTLGDVQVLVNGAPAPLMSASPQQINFQIPSKAALGLTEIDAVRVSTDEVLATSFVQVESASPALFTTGAAGQGQVLATNVDDNSTNSQSHPVKAGHSISLFGTGQGVIPGGPADGTAAKGPAPTPAMPLVYLGGTNFIPASAITYSGLAKGMVGVWQITATVPSDDAPGVTPVFVSLDGNFSSLFDLTNQTGRLITTIYVTQ